MVNKTCYIISFYLGERRKTIDIFDSGKDKLWFLKNQILLLEKYSHSLSKIIFNFNIRSEDYKYIEEIFKITPKFIQNAEVVVRFRENVGISYGAYSDSYDKIKHDYDYFIFNEDDYFFTQNNWDEYLINKYNSYNDCGYLCMQVREPYEWNKFRKHAGHSTGIASKENLLKVWNKYNCLPHNTELDYVNGEDSQRVFSFAFLECGLNIYDIRNEYSLDFASTNDNNHDIWRYFTWNDKKLLTPAFFIENPYKRYSWYQETTGEVEEDFKPTTYKEAMWCYNNKLNYKNIENDGN